MTLARLLAVKISLALLLFSGCATAPRKAPRFDQPSTVEIRKAIALARTHIQHAKTVVAAVSIACPDQKPQIDAISSDLDGALSELQTSEGARAQLDIQLTQQTDRANQLADDYDKSGATITSLQQSRHGWVKRFWMVTGALTLAAAWIFRKPLLALTGIGI